MGRGSRPTSARLPPCLGDAVKGRVVAVTFALLWAATGGAEAETETGFGSVWNAADRLGLAGHGIAANGWWAEVQAVTREAVPGEWESEIALGTASSGRLGGGAGWRRTWSEEDADTHTHTLSLFAALYRGNGWGSVGWSTSRRESLTRSHAWLRGAWSPAPGVLAGGEARVYPAVTTGAPDLRFWVVAVRGPGTIGLRLGPEPGNYLIGLAVRLQSGVSWSVHMADLNPTLGVSWSLGRVTFHGESTRHPYLGAVTRFCVRWRTRP